VGLSAQRIGLAFASRNEERLAIALLRDLPNIAQESLLGFKTDAERRAAFRKMSKARKREAQARRQRVNAIAQAAFGTKLPQPNRLETLRTKEYQVTRDGLSPKLKIKEHEIVSPAPKTQVTEERTIGEVSVGPPKLVGVKAEKERTQLRKFA